MYISEDSITSTIEKFYEEYGKITQEKIIILIDRPIKLKNPENRKSFVQQLIDGRKINATIYFIDEFGKMFLYKKDIERFLFDEPLPNTQRFIEHQVKEKGEIETNPTLASKLISEWFQSENQPVIVLLGEGGIGKTTLAKYFINHKFRNNKESNYVLFLDSSSIIDRLNNYNINAIYDLYRASESDNSFTEELFKLAIDNGSLTIVLDGLDEIISRLNDKFQLDNFLYNICNKYCFNSAKTKIIITCRDSIWYESTNRLEKQLNNLSIREITLNPFDDNQAKDFFEKCFKDDVRKQKKSMNLVQKMNESSIQKLYNPFALETIYSIVSDDTDTESLFSSDKDEMKNLCFNVTNTTDYLIYAICKREYKKIGFELGIQISVLCELSKRRVSRTDFVQVLQKVTNNQSIREEQINLFLAHPFIHENKTIGLRYDFLKEFFSCLLISTNLSNNKMDSYCFDIVRNKVGYLNDFSKEVSKRVFISQDDITIYCMSTLEKDNIDPNCKSSIFLLYLSILQERGMLKNQEDINNAVTDIFCEDKFMKNLCISNVGDDKKTPKLIIDFSDKIIENFHISNYHYFSNCIFNNNTLFKNGTIYLTHHKNSKINFSKENFDLNSVKLDDVMKTTLNNIDKNLENRIKSSEKILHEFIRKFYDNGRFKPQKQTYIKSNQGQHVDKMLEAEVIIEHKNSKLNEKEFVVNPDYKDDFINLLNNGVPNKKIIQLIDKLNQ